MSKAIVTEAHATGSDLYEVISRVEAAVQEYSQPIIIMALIAIVLSMQKPDISEDEIQKGVSEVSRYVCMFLGADTPSHELMN